MRVAMISMHTSPLQQPGTGDSGGMNVYILSTATELAKQGIEVDIYTRATRPSQGEIVRVAENLRVINIAAGPYEGFQRGASYSVGGVYRRNVVVYAPGEGYL